MNPIVDGFQVHPLDLFPRTHQINNLTSNNATAKLDGFNEHPIDSFINNRDYNPYLNLVNAGNGFNVQNNYTNLVQNTEVLKPNLFSPYSTKSFEPEAEAQNTFPSSAINASTLYNQNVGTFQNNEISYTTFPEAKSTAYIQPNTVKYEYMQPQLVDENLLNVNKYPMSTTIITNLDGNYNNTYGSNITYPNYEVTNTNISYNVLPETTINNNILVDNYSPANNISSVNITSNQLKTTLVPYTNTQVLNTENYTTPTITNVTTSLIQPNISYNINKENNSRKSYIPIIQQKVYQTYEQPALYNNSALNPIYNIETYKLPSNTVEIPTTTSIIAPNTTSTVVYPVQKSIVVPNLKRTITPIVANNVVKYNSLTVRPIAKLKQPSTIVNMTPQNAINIIPVTTITSNPVVPAPVLEIKKVQPLYKASFMPNIQRHFRSNTVGNFGNRTFTARNIKFI